MHFMARYAIGSSIVGAVAVGFSAIAFLIAADAFSAREITTTSRAETAPRSVSDTTLPNGNSPSSHLAGTKFEPGEATSTSVAGLSEPATAEGEWVQVVDAVNMRSGPSRSHPVVNVQLEGAQLRVASRDGQWVEIVDPNTGRAGWVYERFVKPIEPSSRQAGLAGDGSR